MTQVRLIESDCLESLPELAADSLPLIVTSPPYDLNKGYERGHRGSLTDYAEWAALVAQACVRVLAPGGSVCWQVGNRVEEDSSIVPLDMVMWPIFHGLGLRCRGRVVWEYPHGVHCKYRFSPRYETVLWLTKGDDYYFDLDAVRVPQKFPNKRYYKGPRKGQLSGNPKGCNPGDVWQISNVKNDHPEKTAHPCQFPEALASRLMLALSRPGDTVLDPFAGSGTVGKVAQATGRAAVLIERDSRYWPIIRERCSLAA